MTFPIHLVPVSALDLTAPGAIMRQSMEGFEMEHKGRCV